MEKIKTIKLTDHEANETYELDFSRDSVRFAEARGFEPEDVAKFPATKVPEFFYYAFRKNHRNLAKSQTDKILEKMGGLTGETLERLMLLYNQAALSNAIATDEETEKNGKVTVEL